jgi:predicted metal-dependent peptidase
MTMNIAMDLVINSMLVRSQIGKVGKDWVLDEKLANSDSSVMEAYRKVYKAQEGGGGKKGDKPQPGGGQGKGQGEGQPDKGQGQPDPSQHGNQKGIDQHLSPGSGDGVSEVQADQDRNQGRWNSAMIAAATAAKVQGKLPLGVERIIKELLEPKVDWRDHLRTALSRKVGSGGSSWAQLDWQLVSRGIGAPGRVGFGAGVLAVGYDSSGSMQQKHLDRGLAECGGIIDELRPRKLFLMSCDAKVQTVNECYDSQDLLTAKIKGGGGTAFGPVFKKIDEEGLEPEALIYFTDMYGSFPKVAPPYPVIWVNVGPTKGMTAPFGEVIEVPVS